MDGVRIGLGMPKVECPGPVGFRRLVTEGLGIRHLRLVLGPTSWTVLARGMGGEEEPHPILKLLLRMISTNYARGQSLPLASSRKPQIFEATGGQIFRHIPLISLFFSPNF